MRRFGAGVCLLFLVTLGVPEGPRSARAEATSSARTMAETYERKDALEECLVYVASDLKTRTEADPDAGPALLLLLVDHTTPMISEIETVRRLLEKTWAAGPRGMHIGVMGVQGAGYTKPSRLHGAPDGALAALAFVPAEGARNLHAEIRDAARLLGKEKGGAKALVLMTETGGEAEDNVEKTRDALLDAECAFYCIAPEAGFERSWTQSFQPRGELHNSPFQERMNPAPRRPVKDSFYYGSEVAIGLVPYGFELDLAQNSFIWTRPPRYPVPSGFGYWNLATLAYTTDGRYFVFDFAAARLNRRQNARRKSFYDFSRMKQLAPDLRPRNKVLKSLNRDTRALVTVRIWQHLADEKVPVITSRGVLERRGASMSFRPAARVGSTSRPRAMLEDMDHVKEMKSFVKERIARLKSALGWWRSADAKERTTEPGKDPLADRVEANFQLLGIQLQKLEFHWHEALAALDTVKPLDVTYRRTFIVPGRLHTMDRPPRTKIDLKDEARNARYAALMLAQGQFMQRYAGTPWALIVRKGRLLTFHKDVRVIEPEPTKEELERQRREAEKRAKEEAARPKAPRPTRPPPPPGPRPGSGTGGPVTGG